MITRLQAAFSALDLYDATEAQELMIAKCRGLMRGYDARWSDTQYQVDQVETLVESDLWNPESGRKSRTFRIAGKLDVTASLNGRRVIIDHKTASDDIEDPNSPYWRQLIVEAQPSHYSLLEWLNGRKADDIVWDVVKKPAIRPKDVAKKDQEVTLRTGLYFGQELSPETLDHIREKGRENLEMYEARLAYDCTEIRPEWYFARRSVLRTDGALAEYAQELWDNAQEILGARNTERHPKSHKACMYKSTPCKFLGICSGYDDPNSDRWTKKEQVHNELPMIGGDGRDVLTQSRLGEFMLCRRKHYFSYELGIERQDEEEAEALFFGNLWHAAQEAWWLALRDEQQQKPWLIPVKTLTKEEFVSRYPTKQQGETNVNNDSSAAESVFAIAANTDETPEYF